MRRWCFVMLWACSPAVEADVLPPCEVACQHAYDCLVRNEVPIFRHCVATCDAKQRDALRELANLSCGELATRLAQKPRAAIVRRTCAELAADRDRGAPPGRRELLMSRAWCASGNGALATGTLHFDAHAVLWGAIDACWALDDKRLAWTLDGVRWESAVLALPAREGDPIGIGSQKLARCVEPRPPPRRPHGTSSRMR